MKSLVKKIRSNKGESLAEAMAAMVLLAFGILMFSAMIIQSGRLMDKGAKNMTYYEEGQNALNARDTGSDYIETADAKLRIAGTAGENDFIGLTPVLRAGEGNKISVRLYRQQLDWRQAGSKTASAEAETKNGSVLFTYDLAAYAAFAENRSDVDSIHSIEAEENAN